MHQVFFAAFKWEVWRQSTDSYFTKPALFTMLTAEQPLLAFGLELMSRPDTAQVVIDLCLMAVLACVWMSRNTRNH